MSRHLHLAVSTSDQDISLAQTVASSDGRPSEAPPERSRAQIAFDETRVGESTAGSREAEESGEIGLLATNLSGPALPAPVDDDKRMKALIKGKLLRSKAAPVKIGRYTVLDRLGEGGMGVVYTAYDDQLERKVAVKILRGEPGRGDSLARTRLKREAQAMARLSHPNIVTVHEVSEFDEQLFVAMEFVRGVSLDGWLKKQDRPWREVLGVFLQAGRGLQAAHAAGIIHRDFKPHNVLVGDDGSVKVLDFGLARASEEKDLPALPPAAAEKPPEGSLLATPLTQTGAIMGTPAYMAPEQHEGRAAVAASDQFAFCVSLYEGLYGRHPFNITSLAALIGDVIAGRVAPPPTGSRVPARIFRALQRGLAVEAARRYPSMATLLADLARDPEAQRRRVLASTGLALFVGAAGFGAAALQQPAAAPVCAAAADELASTWDAARAEAVRSAMSATKVAYAGETWAKIQPQLDAYAKEWVAMRTEACETHASGHQSDKLFDLRTACLDQRRAGFAGLVDALASADAAVVEKAAQAVAGLPPLSRCADVSALTADVAPPEDPRAATRVQGLRETLARAKAQEDAGRYTAALATLEPVMKEAETLAYPPLVAETALRQGSAQMEAGEFTAADASFDRALWTAIASDHDTVAAQSASKRLFLRAVRMGRLDEAKAEIPLAQALSDHVAAAIELRAEFLNNLGTLYFVAADLEHADAALRSALALRDAHGQHETIDQASTLANLGYAAMIWGREREATEHLTKALALAERALGTQHPMVCRIQSTLGGALAKRGKVTQARELLQGLLDHHDSRCLEGSLSADLNLGNIAFELRDFNSARRYFDGARQISAEHPDLTDISLNQSLLRLGNVLAATGDRDGARAQFERTLTRIEAQFGKDHPEFGNAELFYGDALVQLGQPEEALARFARGAQRCTGAEAPSDLNCVDLEFSRALALEKLGRLDAAEAGLRAALGNYERSQGTEAMTSLLAAKALGELLLERRRFDEAAGLLRRAENGYAAIADSDYPKLAEARLALAKALTGDAATASDEARGFARQALDVFTARGEPFAVEAKDAADWLAAHGG